MSLVPQHTLLTLHNLLFVLDRFGNVQWGQLTGKVPVVDIPTPIFTLFHTAKEYKEFWPI